MKAVRFPALCEKAFAKIQGLGSLFRLITLHMNAEHIRELYHIRDSRFDLFEESGPEHGMPLRFCLGRLEGIAANAKISVPDGKNAL